MIRTNNKNHKYSFWNTSIIYGNELIFMEINMSLFPNMIYLLQGKNGSGKSSFFKGIFEHSSFSSGVIRTENVKRLDKINGIYFMPPALSVGEQDTVFDFLLKSFIFLENGVNFSKKNIYILLERFDLIDHKNSYMQSLSLGQQKRLLLLLSTYTFRKIWILDEPTLGLDKFWKKYLCSMIYEHRNLGGTIFVVSHEKIELSFNGCIYL